MQRRVALLVIIVIGITIFVTSSSVFAQGQGGGGGSPFTAIQNQLNSIQTTLDDPATGLVEIKTEVRNIEQSLVDPTSDLTEIKNEIQTMKASLVTLDGKIDSLNSDISFIKAALTDGDSGLQKISDKVQGVETIAGIINTNVGTANAGINTIETEILSLSLTALPAIQNTLDDPTSGLPAIKLETDKIQMMKDDVGTANAGINTIETEIVALSLTGIPRLQATLDDPDTGLGAIQTEILSLDLSGIEEGVADIQATLGDPNIGLASLDNDHNSLGVVLLKQDDNILMVKDDISTLQATLGDPDTGLGAIQTEIVALDLSGIQRIENILDDPTDDPAEPNNIQMIKNSISGLNEGLPASAQTQIDNIETKVNALDLTLLGTLVAPDGSSNIQMIKDDIGTLQSRLIDPEGGILPAIQTETDKIQMAKDDIATIQTTLNNDPASAEPYTITLVHDIIAEHNNRRNIVLGIFSECSTTGNCPFSVDSILIRPTASSEISHPSVMLVCWDDLLGFTLGSSQEPIAPKCISTLAGGGSLGVGVSTTLGFGAGGNSNTPLPYGQIGLDFGPSFTTTLPIGFNHPLWAQPNVDPVILPITGNDLLGSSGVGAVNAEEFVTTLLFDFSGEIEIKGQKDPGVEVKAVVMDSLQTFGTTEGTDGGITQCTDSPTCQSTMKNACFGLCNETSPGTFSASFDSEFENTPIRNAVFTQNENQRSNIVPIVTQSPEFGSNNNQFTTPPKPISFGGLATPDQTFVNDLLERHIGDASSAINLQDAIGAIDPAQLEDELDDLTSSVPTFLATLGIPDPLGEVNTVLGTISTTFTTLTEELDIATSSISSISDDISGEGGLIQTVNGFGGTITGLSNSITELTDGFASVFDIVIVDYDYDEIIEPSYVVSEIKEDEIQTIASYDDMVKYEIVNIPFQTASGQITPIEFVPPGFSSGINGIATGVSAVKGTVGSINGQITSLTGTVTSLTNNADLVGNGTPFSCNSEFDPSGTVCRRTFGGCAQGGNVQEDLIPPQCQVNADSECTRTGFSEVNLADLGIVVKEAVNAIFGTNVNIICHDDATLNHNDKTVLTCAGIDVSSHEFCPVELRGSRTDHSGDFFSCPSGTSLILGGCWENLSFSCDPPYGSPVGSLCRYNPCPASFENYVLLSEITNNGMCEHTAICPSNFALDPFDPGICKHSKFLEIFSTP